MIVAATVLVFALLLAYFGEQPWRPRPPREWDAAAWQERQLRIRREG